jgi:hypothetical protein
MTGLVLVSIPNDTASTSNRVLILVKAKEANTNSTNVSKNKTPKNIISLIDMLSYHHPLSLLLPKQLNQI